MPILPSANIIPSYWFGLQTNVRLEIGVADHEDEKREQVEYEGSRVQVNGLYAALFTVHPCVQARVQTHVEVGYGFILVRVIQVGHSESGEGGI